MPVDKNEWDAGRKWETLEARILTFLRKNPRKGFKITEIYHGLGYQHGGDFWGLIGGVATFSAIQNALDTLVKERTVKAKIVKEAIGEGAYYMAT